jgi:hypothetical protein
VPSAGGPYAPTSAVAVPGCIDQNAFRVLGSGDLRIRLACDCRPIGDQTNPCPSNEKSKMRTAAIVGYQRLFDAQSYGGLTPLSID